MNIETMSPEAILEQWDREYEDASVFDLFNEAENKVSFLAESISMDVQYIDMFGLNEAEEKKSIFATIKEKIVNAIKGFIEWLGRIKDKIVSFFKGDKILSEKEVKENFKKGEEAAKKVKEAPSKQEREKKKAEIKEKIEKIKSENGAVDEAAGEEIKKSLETINENSEESKKMEDLHKQLKELDEVDKLEEKIRKTNFKIYEYMEKNSPVYRDFDRFDINGFKEYLNNAENRIKNAKEGEKLQSKPGPYSIRALKWETGSKYGTIEKAFEDKYKGRELSIPKISDSNDHVEVKFEYGSDLYKSFMEGFGTIRKSIDNATNGIDELDKYLKSYQSKIDNAEPNSNNITVYKDIVNEISHAKQWVSLELKEMTKSAVVMSQVSKMVASCWNDKSLEYDFTK